MVGSVTITRATGYSFHAAIAEIMQTVTIPGLHMGMIMLVKNTERAAAVDHGSFLVIARDAAKEAGQQEDCERELHGCIQHTQRRQAVEQVQLVHLQEQRNHNISSLNEDGRHVDVQNQLRTGGTYTAQGSRNTAQRRPQ